jgi:hypothetical protein
MTSMVSRLRGVLGASENPVRDADASAHLSRADLQLPGRTGNERANALAGALEADGVAPLGLPSVMP